MACEREEKQRCSYEKCEEPVKSLKFVNITKNTAPGPSRVDWSALVGKVLCESCYQHYRRNGNLERTLSLKNRIPDEKKVCFYDKCQNPRDAQHYVHINKDKPPSNGRYGAVDWTSVHDKVLCKACFQRFQKSGKLERMISLKMPMDLRRCTNANCDSANVSYFYQINTEVAEKKAGGQDWGKIAGNVLCKTCYQRYLRRGSLEGGAGKRGKGAGTKRKAQGEGEAEGSERRAAETSTRAAKQVCGAPLL